MCRYTQTRYSCNHFYNDTTIGTGSIACNKCIPVKVALEYWHRQVQYLPIESGTGATIPCPQACRPVRPLPRGAPCNRAQWQADDAVQRANMAALGIDNSEISEILNIEATPNKDSMRPLPKYVQPLQQYPPNWYNFIKDLAVYQSIPNKPPNVRIVNVTRGCGRPGAPLDSNACLAGWRGPEILMTRMKEWNKPPYTRWLHIDYGNVAQLPPREPNTEPVASAITIPISEKLHQLLVFLRQNAHDTTSGENEGENTDTPSPSLQTRRRASSLPERTIQPSVDPSGQEHITEPGPDSATPERTTEPAAQMSEPESTDDDVDEAMAAVQGMQISEADLFMDP